MIVPFPPLEKDKASYNASATSVALNVLPVADGWGPFPALVPYAAALESAPRGSITVRTAEGEQLTIAGTATKLFSVSGAGALTDVSGGTYALPAGDQWSFCLFGERIIATNIVDGPQYYDIGTSADFQALPGTPPDARFCTTVGDFVVLFQLANDVSGLAWSGINNSEQWTVGRELSDRQSFPDGEELQAVIPNGASATLLFRAGMRSMTFAPASGFVFQFSPLVAQRGCTAPRSAVPIGSGDFVYYSDSGFYRGTQGQPIGAERVDRWFANSVREADRRRLEGVADPFRKIVLWRYVTASGASAILGYSWQLDRWFELDANVTGVGIYASSSLTLDDLANLYTYVDDVEIPVDSDAFAGGYPSLAAFDASYRLGYFTGAASAATIETGFTEFTPGGRSFVSAAKAVTDAGTLTMQFGTKEQYFTSASWSTAVSPSPRGKRCSTRSDAMLHAFRLNIPAATQWAAASAVDVDVVRSGAM